MKNLIVLFSTWILLMGCNAKMKKIEAPVYLCKCCKEIETIPISQLIKSKAYYWKIDSMGSNGYRRESSMTLRITKKYDVDYSFVLENFGPGISGFEQKLEAGYDYLVYYVFNSAYMTGKEWKEYKIENKIVFKFDFKSKKLISVFLSTTD